MKPVRLSPDPGTAAALAALDRSCFSDPWSENSFSETLASDRYAFFGIFAEERLIAYAGLIAAPDAADVTRVAVLPEYRRRGLARLLMTELTAEAARRGIPRLQLEVRESNAPAAALYGTLGFKIEGRRRNYYRRPTEDAILMSRAIGDDTVYSGITK